MGNWISKSKKIKLNLYFIPYTEVKSIWIKDLNVRAKTIKLINRNIGGKHCDIRFVNNCLDMTPKAEATKKNVSSTVSKFKTFVHQSTLSTEE